MYISCYCSQWVVDFIKRLKLIMKSVRFNSRQTTMLVSTAILVYVYTQFVFVHTQHILKIYITAKNEWQLTNDHISVNNGSTWNKFQILFFYNRYDGLSQKTISLYCPFKRISSSNLTQDAYSYVNNAYGSDTFRNSYLVPSPSPPPPPQKQMINDGNKRNYHPDWCNRNEPI